MASPTAPTSALSQLRPNWAWHLVLGILFIILGLMGLQRVMSLTITTAFFFGVLILIGGFAQLIEAFKCIGWKSTVWHILIALLYLVAGASILMDPLAASIIWTAIIAGALVFIGVSQIVMSLSHRESAGWFGVLLSGLVSLLLGMMLFAKWPVSGLWAIGLFVAIELIMHGAALVALALSARTTSA